MSAAKKFKAGQKVKIFHGQNGDIRSTFTITKILGEDIYLDWDCYWFPIQDTDDRKIEIIE